MGEGPPAETLIAQSIAEIGQERWNSCFPGVLEDYDYLAAVEAAGLDGFVWRYIAVQDQNGQTVAAAPVFVTDHRLDLTLAPAVRRMTALVRRVYERALVMRLAALGSPCLEDVGVGFAPALGPAQRIDALGRIMEGLETVAVRENAWLLAVKDAPERDRELWSIALGPDGWGRAPGMPGAELPITFADEQGYLARLGRQTRKDMRRKLRSRSAIEIERRTSLAGLEDRIDELYRQTRERSSLQFETLTAAYFTGVLARMEGRASCVLYWRGRELLGFNLLLSDGRTLLDKFFCMGSEGRDHDLYFLSWFENVGFCVRNNLARYQSGQAGYGSKLRLGSRLIGADLWFRHRRAWLDVLLQRLAPYVFEDPVAEDARTHPSSPPPSPPASRALGLIPALIWVAMPVLSVLNQFCAETLAQILKPLAFGPQWLLHAMGSKWLWLWLALEVATLTVWTRILSETALSKAFPLTALSYVLVIAMGWAFFHEPMSPLQWVGGAAILAGIKLIGMDNAEARS